VSGAPRASIRAARSPSRPQGEPTRHPERQVERPAAHPGPITGQVERPAAHPAPVTGQRRVTELALPDAGTVPLPTEQQCGHERDAERSHKQHEHRWARGVRRRERVKNRQLPDEQDFPATRRRCARNTADPSRVPGGGKLRNSKPELAIARRIDLQIANGVLRAHGTLRGPKPHLQPRASCERGGAASDGPRDHGVAWSRFGRLECEPQRGADSGNRREQGPDDGNRSGDQPPPSDADYVVVRITTPRAASISSPVHWRWLAYAKLIIGRLPPGSPIVP